MAVALVRSHEVFIVPYGKNLSGDTAETWVYLLWSRVWAPITYPRPTFASILNTFNPSFRPCKEAVMAIQEMIHLFPKNGSKNPGLSILYSFPVLPYVVTNLYVEYNEQGSSEPSTFLSGSSQWTTSVHFRGYSLEKEEPKKAKCLVPVIVKY